MKHIICLLSVLAGLTVSAAEDAAKDKQSIQGTWQVVSAIQEGKEAAERNGWFFEITADKLTMKMAREMAEGLTLDYRLDPSATPKAIDTTHELDPGKPIVQKGIYELSGDTLKLHFEAAGKKPPATFDSKPGGTSSLFILKRVKAAAK